MKTQGKKPGRPRNFDPEWISKQAMDLFWKEGFASTTTRGLEQKLGLSQSSLYNHFGSKSELINQVLDRYEKKTTEALLGQISKQPAGVSSITEFFDALAKWVTCDGRRGCLLINTMAETGIKDEALKKRTWRYRNKVREVLLKNLDFAADAGQIQQGNNQSRANLLVSTVLGFNIAARGGASKRELAGILESVTTVLESWSK